VECDMCSKPIPTGHNMWVLDKGKLMDGQLVRRGGPDVFCSFACLADRVEGEGHRGQSCKTSTGVRRRKEVMVDG